jgi:hypothetical protein
MPDYEINKSLMDDLSEVIKNFVFPEPLAAKEGGKTTSEVISSLPVEEQRILYTVYYILYRKGVFSVSEMMALLITITRSRYLEDLPVELFTELVEGMEKIYTDAGIPKIFIHEDGSISQ